VSTIRVLVNALDALLHRRSPNMHAGQSSSFITELSVPFYQRCRLTAVWVTCLLTRRQFIEARTMDSSSRVRHIDSVYARQQVCRVTPTLT